MEVVETQMAMGDPFLDCGEDHEGLLTTSGDRLLATNQCR